MNWNAVAAISELVAALGVIITLVCLAVQIRGNTRVTNAFWPSVFRRLWAWVNALLANLPHERGQADE